MIPFLTTAQALFIDEIVKKSGCDMPTTIDGLHEIYDETEHGLELENPDAQLAQYLLCRGKSEKPFVERRDVLVGAGLCEPPATWAAIGNNPPKTYAQLSVRWPAVVEQMQAIASAVSYDMLSSTIAPAILEGLGIGGAVDTLDPRSLVGLVDDPTMDAITEGALAHLLILRADWFNADGEIVPKPETSSSLSYQALQSEASSALIRQRLVRERRAKAREAQIQTIVNARTAAFASFDLEAGLNKYVDALSVLEHNVLFNLITAPDPTKMTQTMVRPTWLPADVVSTIGAKQEITESVLEFLEQYIQAKLAARLPTWFKTLQDGSPKIRSVPLKAKTRSYDRATRSSVKSILRLIGKYGIAKVGPAFLLAVGSKQTWEEIGPAVGPGDAEPPAEIIGSTDDETEGT